MEKECEICGRKIERVPSRFKNRKHIYCSNKCKVESFKTIKEVPCSFCGKLTKSRNHLRNKHNFCNRECTNRFKAQTYKKDFEIEIDFKGCHIIKSHFVQPNGYVKVKRNGKEYTAHRWIYQQKKGNIPKGMIVRHSCDNKLCINPDHLLLGTYKDNMQDAVRRNRLSCGDKHYNSKLSENQVRAIIEIGKNNKKYYQIAKEFNVNRTTIERIIKKLSWKHIH